MATSGSPPGISLSPPFSTAPPRISTPELFEDPVLDSPPPALTPALMSPYSLFPAVPHHSLTPQSMPGTPQLSHRSSASGGRLREGIKRMFVRPPVSQSSVDRANPSSAEEPYQSSDVPPLPKTKRYHRLRIKGTFRRIKRRSDKGQYHSDDGYTSDPGPPMPEDSIPPPDMDDDDETDGADSSEGHAQGVEVQRRAERQRRELQRKLEKTKNQLQLEKGHYQETQNVYLQDLETTCSDKAQQRIKSRFQRDHVKSHAAIEQNLKKIEKYEKDLVLLQEGGAKEGLRGRIEEGLKLPLAGIKKGFNMAGNKLKKGKRYIIRTRSSQGEVEGELGEEGKYAVELIEEEEEEEDGSLVLEESEVVTKATLEALHKQSEELKTQMEGEEARITTMEEVMEEVLNKVRQVKDTYERLQDQVNDVIDLHQNAVGELRGQLSQVESMTVGKTQDLEDAVEEYQSKVEKLEALIHSEIERKAEMERARNCMMMVVAKVVTFVLQAIAIILKISSILSTKAGAASAVIIIIVAVLYFTLFRTDTSS